jgi:Zn-finger nucleic acid-binding protein
MPSHCPVCASHLQDDRAGEEKILTCTSCHGHWLDRDAAGRVVAGMVSCVESARGPAPREQNDTNPYRRAPRQPKRVRGCVECAAPMQQTFLRELDVILDSCAAHGIWFDAGELARVARWFAAAGVRLEPGGDPDVDPVTLALLSQVPGLANE